MKHLRRWNAVVSAAVMLLLLLHGIAGGYQLMSVLPGGNRTLTVLAWAMAALICIHAVFGAVLTVDTMKKCRQTGVGYFRENLPFWVRRISGAALMLFAVLHVLLFSAGGDSFRLHNFGAVQLALSILLVISVLVHILTNLKPLAIALGSHGLYGILLDILLVVSVVLVFCAVAFVVYYFRWNILWRP